MCHLDGDSVSGCWHLLRAVYINDNPMTLGMNTHKSEGEKIQENRMQYFSNGGKPTTGGRPTAAWL